MKINQILSSILTAGLAVTLLMGAVFTPPVMALPTEDTHIEDKQPICVYGKATAITEIKGGHCIMLENSNDKDPNQQIVVNISPETVILDAVTGTEKSMKDIKENEVLYAYVGPAMATSLPPQAHATLILCNIPADFFVPTYAEVKTVTPQDDGKVDVLMTGNILLHLDKDTELLSCRTLNLMQLKNIKPGTHLLSWYSMVTRSMPGQATPTKVMIFPAVTEVEQTITRQEFIDMMYTSVKNPTIAPQAPFTDVKDSPSVNWAYENKIILGNNDTLFMPGDALTREQQMSLLLRYAVVLNKGPVGSWAVAVTYQDAAEISPWAMSGAMWNEITKLVKPDTNNKILPTAKVLQSEAAASLAGILAR